jgi:tetratricopeptide (TPR) repeat protein
VGGAAARRLRASRLAADADAATQLAAASALAGRPAGALAALLIALQRRPNDGLTVMNGGAVLLTLERPGEALAFFERARALGGPASLGLGVSFAAALAANRAAALLALGGYEQAEQAARAAVRASPYLVEARETLATALLCQRKERQWACEFRAAQRRPLSRGEEQVACAAAARRRSPYDLGDFTVGRPLELPKLAYPSRFEQAKAYLELYAPILRDLGAAATERYKISQSLQPKIRAYLARVNPATRRRTLSLLFAFTPEALDPFKTQLLELDRLRREAHLELDDLRQRLDAAFKACSGPDFKRCFRQRCLSASRRTFAAWRRQTAAFEGAFRAYWRALSTQKTGAVANLAPSTPLARSLVVKLEAETLTAWSTLVQHLVEGTGGFAGVPCIAELEEPEAPPAPAEPPAVKASPCPPALGALSWSGQLALREGGPSLGLKVNCSEVEVEVSQSVLPLLSGFAKASRSLRDGTTTLLVGAKAGKYGASFESGLYVSFDRRGSVADVGWKLGPKLEPSGKFGKLKLFGDTVKLSFVKSGAPASLSALPTFGG